MTDFTGFNYKDLVINFKKIILEEQKQWYPNGINCIDKETFIKDNPNISQSIFEKMDFNHDGYISENEYNSLIRMDLDQDGKISENENNANKENAMNQALFFARRNIDKWFTIDINRDGHWSNVEDYMATFRMDESNSLKDHQHDAAMSNSELANKYGMSETIDDTNGASLSRWMEDWADYIKQFINEAYGVELSDADMVKVKKEMIKQINTWLFKTGDNATHNSPLYQSLNIDSYTRLETHQETVSCCGGAIIPPPAADNKLSCSRLFTSMEQPLDLNQQIEEEIEKFNIKARQENMSEEDYNKGIQNIIQSFMPYNTAEEVKNRLAWAMFPTPPGEKLALYEGAVTVWQDMSDEEYAQYHEKYMRMRNMTAADFRELLKPENKTQRLEFEQNSWMTVSQIVQYIDIVESVTGVDFDSSDWGIDSKQFFEIGTRINDTQDDENLLKDKTRADIPENRQDLLKFLEENGWLYEQFKN